MKSTMICSLLLGMILLAGCRSVSSNSAGLLTPVAPQSESLFLDTTQNQAHRLELFFAHRTVLSEPDKIRYLLAAIQDSPHRFVRNDSIYDGSQAMRWLRWKMGHAQFRSNPIRTGRDFVDRVADRSLATGQPYQVIFADGSKHNLQDMLNAELAALEQKALEFFFQSAGTEALSEASSSTQSVQPLGVPSITPAA